MKIARAKKDEIEMMIQVNGKLRSKIKVPADADKESVEAMALADDKVRAALAGAEPRKVIVVSGRLVNIVV